MEDDKKTVDQIRDLDEVLLRELRHLSAASWTGRAKHVAALGSLLHRRLIIRYRFLFFTFNAKHFSQ
jgi:hypothetical protein